MEDVGNYLHRVAALADKNLSQAREKYQSLENTATQEAKLHFIRSKEASYILSEAKKQAETTTAAAREGIVRTMRSEGRPLLRTLTNL